MDLADRLRQRRKFLMLTQVQLAEKAGTTQQLIQQIETRKTLTTGKMVALAEALGVHPKWLETGEGPMCGEEISPDEREMLKHYRALELAKKPIARMAIQAMRSLPIEDVSPNFTHETPPVSKNIGRRIFPKQLPPPPNNGIPR